MISYTDWNVAIPFVVAHSFHTSCHRFFRGKSIADWVLTSFWNMWVHVTWISYIKTYQVNTVKLWNSNIKLYKHICSILPYQIVIKMSDIIWCQTYWSTLVVKYRQTFNIKHTSIRNKLFDNSDVVGASPVSAAQTISSMLTPGFNGLSTENCKARQETLKFFLFGVACTRGFTVICYKTIISSVPLEHCCFSKKNTENRLIIFYRRDIYWVQRPVYIQPWKIWIIQCNSGRDT